MKPVRLGAFAATLIAAVFFSAAHAQQAGGARMEKMAAELEKRFAAADTNKDGCITKDEASSKMPRIHKNFEAIDKDKKGCVTMEQVKVAGAEKAQAAKKQ